MRVWLVTSRPKAVPTTSSAGISFAANTPHLP
jgi:hypothetical protein